MRWNIRMTQLGLGAGLLIALAGYSRSVCAAQTNSASRPDPLKERVRVNIRPNIILIVADGLGWGDLSCYGQTRWRTPHLDRLAAEGMRFTQCYAGSPLRAASRACLLSGLHTGHQAIRGARHFGLAKDQTILPQWLRAAGYKTGAAGVWGLNAPGSKQAPNVRGFEEWFGYLDLDPTNRMAFYRNEYRLGLNLQRFTRPIRTAQDLFSLVASNYVRVTKYFSFFLYLPWPLPHDDPVLVKGAPDYEALLRERADAEQTKTWPKATRERIGRLARLDEEVGALIHELQRLKLDANTVIILTSDTGPAAQEGFDPQQWGCTGRFRGRRGELLEGALRVPLLVRWPARVPAGVVSDHLCALWDLAPTLLDIAEAKVPKHLDGISMLPTLLGQPQTNRHEYVYWEVHGDQFAQAARKGPWKAIRAGTHAAVQLYNLETDPAEQQDLAARHPELTAQFIRLFKEARRDSPLWPVPLKPDSQATKPSVVTAPGTASAQAVGTSRKDP